MCASRWLIAWVFVALAAGEARSEPFVLVVFHGGSLAGSDIRELTTLPDVHFEPVDTSASIPERWANVWSLKPEGTRLPWAAILPPDGESPPLWSGPLEITQLRAYLAAIPANPESIPAPHEAESIPAPHEIEDPSGLWAGFVLIGGLLLMALWRGVVKGTRR